MKKVCFTVLAALSLLATGTDAQAQKLIYNKQQHPVIEIQLSNMLSAMTFYIKDEKGTIVKKGAVAQNGKVALQTADLKSGHYRFEMAGVTQDFEVR